MQRSTSTWRRETQVAIDAVTAALATARSRAGASDLTMKGARDIVTATDIAIEDAVRSGLGNVLGAVVIGEERGGEADGTSHWIVDPICGTRNYASGIPPYCTKLALVEHDTVTVAVVGDPSTGDLVVAQAGEGAWVLRGGARQQARVSAENQTIVNEDSHAEGARREQAATFVADMIRSNRWDLRARSSTLSLAYLATGRVSAYVLFWTSAIHAAAGSLIATEAGATVSDLDGQPLDHSIRLDHRQRHPGPARRTAGPHHRRAQAPALSLPGRLATAGPRVERHLWCAHKDRGHRSYPPFVAGRDTRRPSSLSHTRSNPESSPLTTTALP